MDKSKYVWDHFEETFAAISVLIMAIINFSNVVGRFVFNKSFAWADELTLVLFLWATMLGAAMVFKRGGHFSMGLLSESGSRTRRIVLAVIILIANVGFSVLVMATGVKMVTNQIEFHGLLPAMHISQAFQGFAIPVGGFFMIIRSIEGFVLMLKKEE